MALVMFVSLILLVVNAFDPRIANKADIIYTMIKLSVGAVLGFFIILLYGVGVPGLKYLFMLIGIGGITHLLMSYKTPEVYKL